MNLEHRISKTSNLSADAIIQKIITAINARKYSISNITENSVSFKNDISIIALNWQFNNKIECGEFQVRSNTEGNLVEFSYFPILLFEPVKIGLILSFIVAIAVISGVYLIALISLPILAIFINKYSTRKYIASKMLDEAIG